MIQLRYLLDCDILVRDFLFPRLHGLRAEFLTLTLALFDHLLPVIEALKLLIVNPTQMDMRIPGIDYF